MSEGKSESKNSKEKGRGVTWDEETIAEHNKERGTRMKIEEPKTPFHYEGSSSADGSVETSPLHLPSTKEGKVTSQDLVSGQIGGTMKLPSPGKISSGKTFNENGETPPSSYRPSFEAETNVPYPTRQNSAAKPPPVIFERQTETSNGAQQNNSSNPNVLNQNFNSDLLMNRLNEVSKEQQKTQKRRDHYKGMGALLSKKWDDDDEDED
eukprot:g2138.t1